MEWLSVTGLSVVTCDEVPRGQIRGTFTGWSHLVTNAGLQLSVCETQSLFLCYYLLIIVLFSTNKCKLTFTSLHPVWRWIWEKTLPSPGCRGPGQEMKMKKGDRKRGEQKTDNPHDGCRWGPDHNIFMKMKFLKTSWENTELGCWEWKSSHILL